jgi:hypothetical protein
LKPSSRTKLTSSGSDSSGSSSFSYANQFNANSADESTNLFDLVGLLFGRSLLGGSFLCDNHDYLLGKYFGYGK